MTTTMKSYVIISVRPFSFKAASGAPITQNLPQIEKSVQATNPEEALKAMKYFPYHPQDFGNIPVQQVIPRMRKAALQYYGLLPSADLNGNGENDNWTILIEHWPDGHFEIYPREQGSQPTSEIMERLNT